MFSRFVTSYIILAVVWLPPLIVVWCAGLLGPGEPAEGGAAPAVVGAAGGRPGLRRHPPPAADHPALQTTCGRGWRRPVRVPPALLLQPLPGVS